MAAHQFRSGVPLQLAACHVMKQHDAAALCIHIEHLKFWRWCEHLAHKSLDTSLRAEACTAMLCLGTAAHLPGFESKALAASTCLAFCASEKH